MNLLMSFLSSFACLLLFINFVDLHQINNRFVFLSLIKLSDLNYSYDIYGLDLKVCNLIKKMLDCYARYVKLHCMFMI